MRHSPRRNLTLIELVIVLLVLVGLAGLLVPQFGNTVVATHGATGASNISEIVKAVQLHSVRTFSEPNQLCSLQTAAGTLSTTINLDTNGDSNPTGDDWSLVAAPTGANAALAAAGITQLSRLDSAAESATFNSELQAVSDLNTNGTPTPTNTHLVVLTAQGVTRLGLNPAGTYVVLGLGQRCTMIGQSMTDAPIHFPEGADGTPDTTYARFLLIYDVSGERAKFVGACANDDGTISGLNKHLAEYFEAQ